MPSYQSELTVIVRAKEPASYYGHLNHSHTWKLRKERYGGRSKKTTLSGDDKTAGLT